MKVLQFTAPRVRPTTTTTPIVTAYWTGEGTVEPIPISVRHQHGGFLVASIVDGEEYDAVQGLAILVDEATVLECTSRWTWVVQAAWNEYGTDTALRSDEPTIFELAPLGVQRHSPHVDHEWRRDVSRLWNDERVILNGDCRPLESEVHSREYGEFSRMLWHAWKYLIGLERQNQYQMKPGRWEV